MPNLPSPFSKLPDVTLPQPPDAWIHTQSVQGPHGITASVRNFAEVLDWQEKRRALTQGYYRLIHPPGLQRLKARLEKRYPGHHAVFLTSGNLAAQEWADVCSLTKFTGKTVKTKTLPAEISTEALVVHLERHGIQAGIVLTSDADRAALLHERNRRRGGALSLRNAEFLLEPAPLPEETTQAASEARHILLSLCSADEILFYPSGMAAVTATLEAVLTPETPGIAVTGNVYRDTHLLLEEMPWAGLNVQARLLDTGDLHGLRQTLNDPSVGSVFLETITNPLIELPDLPEIVNLAKHAGKTVIVDNTMASPLNCRPLEWGADLVIHSTSKYLSGGNQHGGGIVLTRSASWAERLRTEQNRLGNHLSPLEIPVLLDGLRTFNTRMPRFNRNGQAVAEMLRDHPAVDRVFFGEESLPEWLTGLGSVVSCTLNDPGQAALARVFDAEMPGIIKAPSLGSNQTLFCPYVFLTYYDKSDDYLEACHLPRHLLRFAVGCEEDPQPVLAALSSALMLAVSRMLPHN